MIHPIGQHKREWSRFPWLLACARRGKEGRTTLARWRVFRKAFSRRRTASQIFSSLFSFPAFQRGDFSAIRKERREDNAETLSARRFTKEEDTGYAECGKATLYLMKDIDEGLRRFHLSPLCSAIQTQNRS